MLYIIKTEERRKVGEIKWDHEAENMEEPLRIVPLIKDHLTNLKIKSHSMVKKKRDGSKYSETQYIYRRLELYLQKLFRILIIPVILLFLGFVVMFIGLIRFGFLYLTILLIIMLVVLLSIFIPLYRAMKLKHRYEFETN